MSNRTDADGRAIGPADIRREVYRQLRTHEDGRARGDLVAAVSQSLAVEPNAVDEEVDRLEENGLVYVVDGGVKVP